MTGLERSIGIDLQRLLAVRLALLGAIVGMLWFADAALGLPLPLTSLGTVLTLLVAGTAASWLWLRQRRLNAGAAAMSVQLAIDLLGLTAILYYSGGWTNPLISLYLVPVAVSAAVLSARTTWLFAAAALIAYSLLAVYHVPVFTLHHGGDFTVHIAGMWLTFATAAALIAFFGTSLAATVRRQQQDLADARERNLRNEQILGIATLAAGTAHELSTPLTSIAVIASELEAASSGEMRHELQLLLRQVAVCREALQRLRESAATAPRARPADRLLSEARDRFRLLRPTVTLALELPEAPAAPDLLVDGTFQQSLLSLLDNAADVSPAAVTLAAAWADDQVQIDVLDRGPGLDRHRDQSGGMGVGLLLAGASIERLGGTLQAAPRAGGGTRLRITLPAHPRATAPSAVAS
jgi:two-component system, sensor histidine kinase RegB